LDNCVLWLQFRVCLTAVRFQVWRFSVAAGFGVVEEYLFIQDVQNKGLVFNKEIFP